jgi:hypothetical protein
VSVMIQHDFVDGAFYKMPLGVVPTRLTFGFVPMGGTFWDSLREAVMVAGCEYLYQIPVTDHRPEIAKLYGKPADQLVAPEGYEFTGEFREVWVDDDWYLNADLKGAANCTKSGHCHPRFGHKYHSISRKSLILRPIAKKAEYRIPITYNAPPPPPTAEDIKEKFGRELLDTFYGRPDVIQDVPGFEFTGRLQSVPPGEWYLNTAGQAKQSGAYGTVGLYLTLTKVAGPRIITYTLTSREDLDGGEARYCPDDMGGMMTDTSDSSFVYTRSEVS